MAESEDSREKQRQHVRKYRAANRDKLNEKTREYMRARKLAMGSETYNANARAWRAANRDEVNARRRALYAADPAKFITQGREARRKGAAKWNAENPVRAAYTKHKHHAKMRDIPFLLTFDEWWSIWGASGQWLLRGHCKGQYVMARTGDKGPYAVGNVRITTVSDNHAEAWGIRRKRRHD